MNRFILLPMLASAALAAHADTYFDNAQVRSVQAQYESVAVPRKVQTCQTVNDVQQRLTGYQVSYEYRGQQFSTVLPENPGPNLKVRVSIDPVLR